MSTQLLCRSPGELSRYAIQQWKELSAQDVSLPPLTAWSKLVFALSWVKYTVVPEPIRYVCFCIWACLCTAWAPFHKRLTLQGEHTLSMQASKLIDSEMQLTSIQPMYAGAKLDVYLLHRAYPDAQVTVPQAVILKRFHHNMSIVETAAYRLGLLKVQKLQCCFICSQMYPFMTHRSMMYRQY